MLNYVPIPTELIKSELISSNAKLTFLGLSLFANIKTHRCYVRISIIAQSLGLSESSVKRGIKELSDNKYINIINRTGHSSIYDLSKLFTYSPSYSPEGEGVGQIDTEVGQIDPGVGQIDLGVGQIDLHKERELKERELKEKKERNENFSFFNFLKENEREFTDLQKQLERAKGNLSFND